MLGFLLAAFAGVFLAIGAGHLLPEAQHRRPGASPLLVLLTAVGAAVVLVVRSIAGLSTAMSRASTRSSSTWTACSSTASRSTSRC